MSSLASPLPAAKFCPTGGIDPDKAKRYLALPNVVCVGGSWLVPRDAVRQGDWARITELARGTGCAMLEHQQLRPVGRRTRQAAGGKILPELAGQAPSPAMTARQMV